MEEGWVEVWLLSAPAGASWRRRHTWHDLHFPANTSLPGPSSIEQEGSL